MIENYKMNLFKKVIFTILLIFSANLKAVDTSFPPPRDPYWPIPPIVPIITNIKQTIKNGGKWLGRVFVPLGVVNGIQDCRKLGVVGATANILPVPYYSCDPDPAKGGFGCGLVDAVEAQGIRSDSMKIIRLPCGGVCILRNPFSIVPYIVEKEQDFWGQFTEDPTIESQPPSSPIPPWEPPIGGPFKGWGPSR